MPWAYGSERLVVSHPDGPPSEVPRVPVIILFIDVVQSRPARVTQLKDLASSVVGA